MNRIKPENKFIRDLLSESLILIVDALDQNSIFNREDLQNNYYDILKKYEMVNLSRMPVEKE